MVKKINLSNPIHQFSVVLAINLIFFSVLYLCPTSNYNLHPPEGAYSGNILRGSDVGSYLYPARNFIEQGIFGQGDKPGYLRTIGYSAYEVVLITIFGESFFWVAYFIQAILAALVFATITAICNFFIKDDSRVSKTVFAFLCLGGAYWSYFYLLATDLFFAFFFIAGIYYGIKAVADKSWKKCIIHILLIGYAASVRPTLILYVIPELFILLCAAAHFKTLADKKIKVMIGVTCASVLLLTNLPSLRNYVNYGVMKPSNVFEINLHHFLAKETLILVNREDQYEREDAIASNIEKVNWGDACAFKKEAAFRTIREYPTEALIVLTKHLVKNLATPHYLRGTFVLLFKFKEPSNAAQITLDGTIHSVHDLKQAVGLPILVLSIIFICIYPLLWLLVIKHLVRMVQQKQYLYCLTIVLFFGYLIAPTLPCANGARSRLASEWLIVLLATVEFYYWRDKRKANRLKNKALRVDSMTRQESTY